MKARERYKYKCIVGGRKMRPHSLVLDPTYRCMLDCVSCKCRQINEAFHDEDNLTQNEYDGLIGEFRQLGGKEVCVFGGEPLMFRDLFDILSSAKERELSTSLSTNGILLTEQNSQRLLDAELNSMTISVDGTTENYETIAGRKSFEKLKKSLHTFARMNNSGSHQKIKTQIHVTVMNSNAQGLNSILHFAKEFQIPTVSFQYISRVDEQINQATAKMIDGRFRPELNHWGIDAELLVDSDRMEGLKREIGELKGTARRLGISISIDPALSHGFNADYLHRGFFPLNLCCLTLWESIFVGPNGLLSICPMLTHYPIANVREVSLADYWNRNEALVHVRDILLEDKYLPICSSCCLHTRMML